MYDSKILQALSKRLAQELDALPNHDAITDVFDHLCGAVYSLKKCEQLRFWTRHGQRLTNYKKKVSQYLAEIPQGVSPNEYWISGYFFNSALMRIAACYDRVPKLILKKGTVKKNENLHSLMKSLFGDESRYAKWKAVYEEVNRLKHDAYGLATGRSVAKDDVLAAITEVVSLLQEKRNDIASAYDYGGKIEA
jgi:hypothetical protein